MLNRRRTLQTGLATLLSAAAPLRAYSQSRRRESHTVSLTIANGMIVALDEARTVHARGNVLVNGGVIRAVGPDALPTGQDVLDASGAIVLPGFLNAHTHSPETLARGLVDRVRREDWLGKVWPTIDSLTPAQIRVAVLLGCAEMLRSGTTAVVDHFRQTPLTLEAVRAAVTAYREAGMRCAVAVMLRDRYVPPWAKQEIGDLESLCNAIMDEYQRGDGFVSVMLAPAVPHVCTDQLLSMVAAASAKRGIHVQTHLDESLTQRDEAISIYGHSSIRHLESLGLLNSRVSLAHCVWVDDEDLMLLERYDATVVHNPISNLRLGTGIAPVPEMLRRGITVALGSDGAASNDGQNMLEVMKMASLLPGAKGFDPRPTVHDVLAMTTGRVGKRFGMDGIGSIETGKTADLVVFEGAHAPLHPLNDIHRQIVFGGAGLTVRHVVIGGRVVVRDREIQTFDERAVFAEANTFDAGGR